MLCGKVTNLMGFLKKIEMTFPGYINLIRDQGSIVCDHWRRRIQESAFTLCPFALFRTQGTSLLSEVRISLFMNILTHITTSKYRNPVELPTQLNCGREYIEARLNFF